MDNTVERLNQYQKSVIIGTMLGDGYLRIVPGRRDAFLEVNHAHNQCEYVEWKYKVLENVSGKSPIVRNGNGKRRAIRFHTRQSAELTQLYNWFYKDKTKVIPSDLVLDPLILATWFMDDGSWCRASDVYLNTQQFSHHDQQILLDALVKIGLQASLNKDKEYQRIRFVKTSIPALVELVKPHIIPSMQYKIGLESVETTRQSPALSKCDYRLEV